MENTINNMRASRRVEFAILKQEEMSVADLLEDDGEDVFYPAEE